MLSVALRACSVPHADQGVLLRRHVSRLLQRPFLWQRRLLLVQRGLCARATPTRAAPTHATHPRRPPASPPHQPSRATQNSVQRVAGWAEQRQNDTEIAARAALAAELVANATAARLAAENSGSDLPDWAIAVIVSLSVAMAAVFLLVVIMCAPSGRVGWIRVVAWMVGGSVECGSGRRAGGALTSLPFDYLNRYNSEVQGKPLFTDVSKLQGKGTATSGATPSGDALSEFDRFRQVWWISKRDYGVELHIRLLAGT